MAREEDFGICPVCKGSARVSRKWVLNKYGKRYEYLIYQHEGFKHYSNQNEQNSRDFRKGDLEKLLVETINSQEFRLGSFKVADVRKLLLKDHPDIGYGSIKVSLNKLAKGGMIEVQKNGRSLSYINSFSKDRLSFVIDSLAISLEDVDEDGMFKKHVIRLEIRNDNAWPMYYVPFTAAGDEESTFQDIKILASDHSNSSDIRITLLEDAPMNKRVLLRLPSPLLPGEIRELRIEYYWSEPNKSYVQQSATKMDSFEFSLSRNNLARLTASLTSGSTNETTDLSGRIKETSSERWSHVSSITITEVEAFSVLQFKW